MRRHNNTRTIKRGRFPHALRRVLCGRLQTLRPPPVTPTLSACGLAHTTQG